MADGMRVTAMITLVALLFGCGIRFDCQPTGRILWSGIVPMSVDEISAAVDGVMGGISCDFGEENDGRC